MTDHSSLQYLMTQPNLSKRQARWLVFLAEFDYEIVHRPGKSTGVADALSQLGAIECGTTPERHHGVKLFQGLDQAYKRDSEKKKKKKNIDTHLEFCTL